MKMLLMLLFCTSIMYGQWIKIPDKEYVAITFAVDPYASYKESGLDFLAEFILISHFGYVKVGTQIFPNITGGYYDLTGGAGFNQESAILGIETRIYEGIRGGHNWRGETQEFGAYDGPLFGVDLGVDFKISESFSVGGRATTDWREDMKYSGAEATWIESFFVTAIFKL